MSWNRKWTDEEYSEMMQESFDNEYLEKLDKQFNREPGSYNRAFYRVCNDAGISREDRRVYDLSYLRKDRRGKPFTRPIMDYIRIHIEYPNGKQMPITRMAFYVGHSPTEVKDLINRKDWRRKKSKIKMKRGKRQPRNNKKARLF